MTDTERTILKVSDQEITNIRHNLSLLRTQVQAGKVDGTFLDKQLDKLTDLLDRLELEHRQLKKQGRLEALYNVSRLLGASLDLQVVLDQVMDAIIQLTGAERGFLMLPDDDGQVEVRVARNFDQQTLSSDKFKYSRTIVSKVLDTGESVVTTNAAEDPRFAGQASIIGQALRSIMATPLRVRGRVTGVVYVDNRAIAGLFEEDDLEALDALAGQAAIAIDNAQLFSATDQKLAERVEELQQLRRIDLQLNETLDPEKAIQDTLEWACRLSNAEVGHLGMIENGHVPVQHHFGVPSDETQPMHLEVSYPHVKDVVSTGIPALINKDGTSILIVPVRHEQKVIGIIILRRSGTFTTDQQDIVERVAARAAAAIENARLYAAVQAADRAKSEFVGIVAHDLKVPMTSILGYADLSLMETEIPSHQVNYLNRIRDTVKRMEVLVSDLSDISRIEGGHFYMNESRVKVADIVQGLRDAIMTQMVERNHMWVENIEPDLPDMKVDYYRLLQILTNLTSNAYKYTADGGSITLDVVRLGERIEFSVSDTGIGMSPEAVQKLGTKFWRADDDFTRSKPGTGLGFAITRSLVEQMDSGIYIESEVGKGSKFTFSVPIYKD
jgi:signal transduction histidine kinase